MALSLTAQRDDAETRCQESAVGERRLLAGTVSRDQCHTADVRPLPPQLPAAGRSDISIARSDLSLLGDLESVIYLDAEIPHRGLQFGVPEEKLDGT